MDSILFLPIIFVVSYNFAIFAVESVHIEHDVIDERQQEAMTDKNMEWKTLSQKYLPGEARHAEKQRQPLLEAHRLGHY